MIDQRFEKILTSNDTGHSGGHQAGIHVPKGQHDLIKFLPRLDPKILNPSVWLNAVDSDGVIWRLRYIYYNNKICTEQGTRDEYRITHLTSYFKAVGALPGDCMVISGKPGTGSILISVISAANKDAREMRPVKLRGWRRVH